jgi:hypothetical protein
MHTRILQILFFVFFYFSVAAQEEVYELRTYELEFLKSADLLDQYFEQALIPALNRQGVKNIGAFEESGERLPKKIYLLIPYHNIKDFLISKDVLESDSLYLKEASFYLKAPEASIPFKSISSSLIRSSSGFPELVNPKDKASLFELRIYESSNEDALRRKVKMFNDSEFGIFKEVGLPMVFFGSNIAGSQMPCLTYLLAFKNKEAHTNAWSKFGSNPEWQRIIKLEEYANAMNDITRVFLKPLSYSQL